MSKAKSKSFKPLDINLAAILAILEQETSSHEDKSDAYSQMTKHMKDDDLSLFDLDLSKHGKQVVSMAIRDVNDDNLKVSEGALHVLGFCLHDKEIVKSLGNPVQTKCISTLHKVLSKIDDKNRCIKALWCLGNQNINDFVVSGELVKSLKVIETVWKKWMNQSVALETEAAKTVIRFYEQDTEGMKENMSLWARETLLSLAHIAPQTGSRLLTIANEVFTRDNVDLWSKTICEEYKGTIGPELKKMMNTKQEVHALKLWSLYVRVLSKELHHGNFINQLLSIVEMGFKSINAEVKVEAFRAWKQLILNFSTDINILSDQKRIKLLMQVFKLNNAKTEPVAMEKFNTWWFFISKLGNKAVIYFDQVCLPLLNFCLGGQQKQGTPSGTPRLQNGVSPVTPHLSLPSNSGSGLPKIEKLQRYAWEVLAFYLGGSSYKQDKGKLEFQLDCPSVEFIPNPAAFLKHSTTLITSVFDVLHLDYTTDAMLHCIWSRLVPHISGVLESGITSDVKEMFTFFLTQFQTFVLSQTVSVEKILVMFDVLCTLPKKALASTAYNISNGEKIHGNPALFLVELLLTPTVLSKSQRNERYMTIFNNLTAVGIENESGFLEFCQSVLELINRNREFIKEPDCIWRLWSRLANTLHDQVNKTNEINQGDSLEHNFSCMYNILVFFMQHQIPHNMAAPVYKTLVKTWCGLYSEVARCSALVTTAEPNICCEALCDMILKNVEKEFFLHLNGLDFGAQACLTMVNCVDFGSIGTVGHFNIGGLSPAKWAKKKQKPLENLHGFVQLLCYLSDIFAELTEDFISSPQKLKSLTRKIDSGSPNMTSILSAIFETIIILYSHVTSSTFLVSLLKATATNISTLYKLSSGWSGTPFLKKTEKLTEAICNSIQKHYTGPVDSEFLQTASPFLEATIGHPRRSISIVTQNLWTSTFSSAAPLNYPESLSKVLQEMAKKHKLNISLPGWVVREENVEDLPGTCSELTQGDSQAPEPHIPGMPSPSKMRGSFLNKAVSPNIKKSPAKPREKAPDSAKKKILPGNFQDDVFVVIKSPPPKNNPLTDHQIEIFREKRTMPAMYNTLDASQDVSLMAHFNTADSQSQQLQKKSAPLINSENGKDKAGQDEVPASVDEKREPRIHGKINRKRKPSEEAGKRPTRSVRFSKEVVEQTSPEAVQKDIAHFNVIKTMLPKIDSPTVKSKSAEKDSSETSDSLIGREEDEIDSAHQLLSLSTPRISPPGKLSGSPVKEEEYQPSPSQRKLDSWFSKTSNKSKTSTDQLPKKQAQNTTPSIKKPRGRPKKSKEDTPAKRTCSSSDDGLKSSQDKNITNSQTNSNDEKVVKTRAKSSEKKIPTAIVEETMSPKKQAPATDPFVKPTDNVKDKLSPVIAVIEETQSPTKSNLIQETPPRPGTSDITAISGNRKLFLSQDVIDECEDSNIIPASPTSNKNLRLGTPVLKLRKLTQDEILQYSPSRKHGETASPTPSRRGRPRKSMSLTPCLSDQTTNKTLSSTDPSSNKSSDKELVSFFLHEHDDFSDLKPISTDVCEDPPVSLGFDVDSSIASKTGDNMSTEPKSSASLSGSESLFTELESQNDSEDYNPCLESTLPDLNVKRTKSSRSSMVDVLKKSEEISEITEEIGTPQKLKSDTENVGQPQMESETYNPLLESTLASPPPFGSARKRKQATPKKLSPESTGPPKRKRRRFSQSNQMADGTANEKGEVAKNKQKKIGKGKQEQEGELNGKIETNLKSLDNTEEEQKIDEKSLHTGEDIAALKQNIALETKENTNVIVGHIQADIPALDCQKKSPLQTDNYMDIDFDESFTEINSNKNPVPNTEIIKTPEGNKKPNLEKTPENRLATDTPTRVSTTKKKKEVAQKRSLSKGKLSIPLDLDAKLEANDNQDQRVPVITEEPENLEDLQSEDMFQTENQIISKDYKNVVVHGKTESKDTVKHSTDSELQDSIVIPETNQEKEETCSGYVPKENVDDEEKSQDREVECKNQRVTEKNETEVSSMDGILTEQDSSNQANIISSVEKVEDDAQQNKTEEKAEAILETKENSIQNTSSSDSVNKESSSTDFFLAKEAQEMLDDEISTEQATREKEGSMTLVSCTGESVQNVESKASAAVSSNDELGEAEKESANEEVDETGRQESEEKMNLSTSATSESDDNVPLKDLKSKSDISPSSDVENQTSQMSQAKKKGGKGKKNIPGKIKTSPLAQRLRSSGRVLRTRGKPLRRSTGDMLSLSKTKKNENKSPDMDTLEDDVQKEKEALSDVKPDNVIIIPSQSQDKEPVDSEQAKKVEVEDIAGPDNLKKFNDALQDETPRKAPDIISTRKDLRFAESFSDSKLVTVPRKFERRSNLARRSILKPNIYSRSLESPSQRKFLKDFHPIKIGHVYSPSASPSAGILKRRRLSGEKAVNSPSPPSKLRRVSFAEPLSVSKEMCERPVSPLVTSKVSSSLEKIFTSTTESQMTDSIQSKSESQSSYASTQQSQLNTTQPVFPELMECTTSVEKILPQLTSSMWARGLGPLIKARNIHTIGDLSSLTEKQVDELPIRSPKVSVVRKVLKKYEQQSTSKRTKSSESDVKENGDDGKGIKDGVVIESSGTDLEVQHILQMETKTGTTALSCVTAEKGNANKDSGHMDTSTLIPGNVDTPVSKSQTVDMPSEIKDTTVSDTLSEKNSSADNLMQGFTDSLASENSSEKIDNTVSSMEEICNVEKPIEQKKDIVSELQSLVEKCSNSSLKDLKTEDIFKIHQQLSKLSNTVVDTLKERCHSPHENK